MIKHTLGPWRVADACFSIVGPPCAGGLPVTIARLSAHKQIVASCQTRANSRLIAAAPDLLEALRRLLSRAEALYVEQFESEILASDGEHFRDELEYARAAIARATIGA